MGKTFRRNDYHRPKKDKGGKKSRKQKEFNNEFNNHKIRPHVYDARTIEEE